MNRQKEYIITENVRDQTLGTLILVRDDIIRSNHDQVLISIAAISNANQRSDIEYDDAIRAERVRLLEEIERFAKAEQSELDYGYYAPTVYISELMDKIESMRKDAP